MTTWGLRPSWPRHSSQESCPLMFTFGLIQGRVIYTDYGTGARNRLHRYRPPTRIDQLLSHCFCQTLVRLAGACGWTGACGWGCGEGRGGGGGGWYMRSWYEHLGTVCIDWDNRNWNIRFEHIYISITCIIAHCKYCCVGQIRKIQHSLKCIYNLLITQEHIKPTLTTNWYTIFKYVLTISQTIEKQFWQITLTFPNYRSIFLFIDSS